MTLADEIRNLLHTHGPLTAVELRALLPDRKNPDGSTRRVRPREIHSRTHAMCQPARSRAEGAMLAKQPDGKYLLLRDPVLVPRTPEERDAARRETARKYEIKRAAAKKAERHARGIKPLSQRGIRITTRRKDEITAEAAQAINRRQMGLRDMPAHERPCTETWLAANADKYERLPTSGPRAVSAANRLKYTYG